MKQSTFRNVFASLLLCFAITSVAFAQDATEAPEATASAPEGTTIEVGDGGTVNIDTETPSDTVPTLINIAIVFAGAIVAGGSFAVIWDRIRRNKQAQDTIEHLASGLSPEWRETINRALDYGEAANKRLAELIEFARTVTDGRPNLPPTG